MEATATLITTPPDLSPARDDGELSSLLGSSNSEVRTEGTLDLNSLLRIKNIDPGQVLVLRHRPQEPKLNKDLPWLADRKPDLFNAYQQTQGSKLEGAMTRLLNAHGDRAYVASFIGHNPGKALFIGLYSIRGSRPITREQFWQVPAYVEMKDRYGMRGWGDEDRGATILWFDLWSTDFYASWKGKLVVGWPPPEISWWRLAHRNTMPVLSILEDSALEPVVPNWREIALDWDELQPMLESPRWKSKLREWRAIHYICDTSDGRGYVGSAYGADNLHGRWSAYANTGHGGNCLLRARDHHKFRFTILQLIAPDEESDTVIRLEATWKGRLNTRWPHGLNDN